MKRRSIIIFVFIVMVAAILGIAFIIAVNVPVVSAAFNSSDPTYLQSAVHFLISVLLIFICWISLLIVFVRLLKSDNFIEFGKKDSVTGIGNGNYLESVYKKYDNPDGEKTVFAYFAFSKKKFLGKYDLTLFNQIQKMMAIALTKACVGGEYVGRLGDGEFGMVLTVSDNILAKKRMIEIVNTLNQCQYRAVFEVFDAVHCGFYCMSGKRASFITALENAKTAYQHAVNHSADTYFYSENLINVSESNKLRAKQLSDAICNDEFEIYMQFIYDIKRKKFIGVEALSRWNSNDGFILPGGYIGDMHSCGVIETFDMYIFDKVCRILRDWKDDGDFKDLFVSCNITRVTISSKAFLQNIRETVAKYDFPHEKLIIEVTEDALIDDLDVAYDNMVACREMGFGIALDDFGAGHTSFIDINMYPFDQVKIDRVFAKSISTAKGKALMSAFIDMAHKLEIAVICEGIETKESAAAVNKLNADCIQGHYYSYVYPMSEVREKYLAPIK